MLHPGRSYIARHISPQSPAIEGIDSIDQLWVESEGLGVKETREIVALASQQPLGSQRLLVLSRAERLTEAVQNTLLKLLEEPPAYLTVVLETEEAGSLLGTIRSRAHHLETEERVKAAETLPAGFLANEATSRQILEKTKDRQEIVRLLTIALKEQRGELLEKPAESTIHNIELLDASIKRLNQNANQKLVVDALLLNWLFNSG